MPASEPSSPKIRVIVVDDITETRENVRKLLFFEDDIEIVGTASNGREGVDLAGRIQPDIVLMDINMPGMDGIAASEAIASQHPNVQVIMMSVQGEADYLRRSMLAGAREFLIKPFSGDELATSIRRVHQLGVHRKFVTAPPPSAATPVAPPPPPPKGGKIIVMFGARGGCGVSTLAVNLAVALRDESKERVALMDANFEFGDIGVLLNLPGQRTIADLTGPTVDIDEDLMNGILSSHGSGIKALLAPPRPEMAELITAEHLKKVLDILPKMFDYIVVDMGRTLREPLVNLLDAADQILLISTSDIPAIKNAKLFFELTAALGYRPEKMCLVLNKEDGRSGISASDISASVKHAVGAMIPKDERTALLALNRGTPFVIHRNLPMSQAVIVLAKSLLKPVVPQPVVVAPVAPPPKKSGWFRRK